MVKDKIRHLWASKCKVSVALIAALLLSAVAPALAGTSPAHGRPLTAYELLQLVKDRTWKWSEGAGRFFGDGRRFIAFTHGKDGPTYGEGNFRLTDNGRLCLAVEWHNGAGVSDAGTCFLHREVDGVIYQRREGSGDWYPFKHKPLLETDEYAKFTKDDLVSEEFAKIKAEVDAKTSDQKGNQP